MVLSKFIEENPVFEYFHPPFTGEERRGVHIRAT